MGAYAYRLVAVACLVVLIGFVVAAAVLLLLRQDDNAHIQVLPPAPAQSGAASASRLGTPAGWATAGSELQVYINGAVQRPGVYPVQPGDRLADVLTAAGGPAPEADLTAVNLARRVEDEGYYYIPRVGERPPPLSNSEVGAEQSRTTPTAGVALSPLVDLNTAPAVVLETLPGIGKVLAQAIVDDRTRNGPFASPEDIMRVSGIGPKTYEQIKHLVTAGAAR